MVRPTTFTDFMVKIAANFVRPGAWGGLGGAGRVALIDIRDVAEVFAVILTDGPHRHAGKIYDISGPAAVTMDELAGYLSAALGTRVEYHARTEPQQRAVLESTGLPHFWSICLSGSTTSPATTSMRSPPPPFSI